MGNPFPITVPKTSLVGSTIGERYVFAQSRFFAIELMRATVLGYGFQESSLLTDIQGKQRNMKKYAGDQSKNNDFTTAFFERGFFQGLVDIENLISLPTFREIPYSDAFDFSSKLEYVIWFFSLEVLGYLDGVKFIHDVDGNSYLIQAEVKSRQEGILEEPKKFSEQTSLGRGTICYIAALHHGLDLLTTNDLEPKK